MSTKKAYVYFEGDNGKKKKWLIQLSDFREKGDAEGREKFARDTGIIDLVTCFSYKGVFVETTYDEYVVLMILLRNHDYEIIYL